MGDKNHTRAYRICECVGLYSVLCDGRDIYKYFLCYMRSFCADILAYVSIWHIVCCATKLRNIFFTQYAYVEKITNIIVAT